MLVRGILFLSFLLASPLLAQTVPPAREGIAVTPATVVWRDAPASLPPGSQVAVLEGDPSAPGIFTMRVRVPAGAVLVPHWHPQHERVTILSGVVELGLGTVADRSKTVMYGPGSFYVNPPGAMHFLFFPENTEMQMTGIGPWEIRTPDDAPSRSAATGTLKLRSIEPAAGQVLTRSTEIVADVDYSIRGFREDSHYFTIAFESTIQGKSFGSEAPVIGFSPSVPAVSTLKKAAGRATVRAELHWVWGNAELKRPIRLRVFLHEKTSERTSRVIAWSDWIDYR
ncbi:MAG TPA: cupin domain-containing protein [Thermoanaerobaculia bacterium]